MGFLITFSYIYNVSPSLLHLTPLVFPKSPLLLSRHGDSKSLMRVVYRNTSALPAVTLFRKRPPPSQSNH